MDFPDWYAGGADVWSRAEWAARTGDDKDFTGDEDNKAFGQPVSVIYTVPAGKMLLITQFACAIHADDVVNGDHNQICRGLIFDATETQGKWLQGGNGGIGTGFAKPIVIEAGHTVYFSVAHFADHDCEVLLYVGGYEV